MTDVPAQHAACIDGPDPVATAGSGHEPVPSPLRLSLRANFRWTFAGNVVNGLAQWGMLTVLARLGSAAEVGQFINGLAIAAPVIALTMLQLRNVQVTDVRGEFAFGDYLATRIAWTAVGLVVIIGIALGRGFDERTAWVVVLVGLTKCIDSVSDIVRGLFQREERMDLSAMSLMVRGPAALAAMALAMWWTGSLVAATLGMTVVWFVGLFAYDLRRARWLPVSGGPGVSAEHLLPRSFAGRPRWRLTTIALPLGIVMALISLQTNIPIYVLEAWSGREQVGYFGTLAYPIAAGMMVVTAIGQTFAPRLARYFADDPSAYRLLLWKFVGLSCGLGIAVIAGVWLLGKPILALLYGAEYTAYNREFTVVAVAGAIQFVASAFGYALTAARRFRTQVLLTGISCVVTAVAALLLVPERGVMGAAMAMVATTLAACIGFGISVRWAYSQRVRRVAPNVGGVLA